VVELQSVHGWAGGDDEQARARTIEEGCYRLAAALGGEYMMVSHTSRECSWDEMVDRFGAIADRAAVQGVDVAIEFLPWGPVPDARTAWRLVEECGRSNAGVLVDVWHHFRGAADDEQLLAIPADRIRAVQFDDAWADVRSDDLYADSVDHRQFPGEGELDLTGFVQLMDQHGVSAPWCVEVLSAEVRALDPVEAAVRGAETTRRVLADARRAAIEPRNL
jgi:sugar phosphate isomerase/epimerase